MRRVNILATTTLSASLVLGFKKTIKIKQAIPIHVNWKENQSEANRFIMLKKAQAKRLRKTELKKRHNV